MTSQTMLKNDLQMQDRLCQDMKALRFEAVPSDGNAMGNMDFQRNSVLVRFWGCNQDLEWCHIVHEPVSYTHLCRG